VLRRYRGVLPFSISPIAFVAPTPPASVSTTLPESPGDLAAPAPPALAQSSYLPPLPADPSLPLSPSELENLATIYLINLAGGKVSKENVLKLCTDIVGAPHSVRILPTKKGEKITSAEITLFSEEHCARLVVALDGKRFLDRTIRAQFAPPDVSSRYVPSTRACLFAELVISLQPQLFGHTRRGRSSRRTRISRSSLRSPPYSHAVSHPASFYRLPCSLSRLSRAHTSILNFVVHASPVREPPVYDNRSPSPHPHGRSRSIAKGVEGRGLPDDQVIVVGRISRDCEGPVDRRGDEDRRGLEWEGGGRKSDSSELCWRGFEFEVRCLFRRRNEVGADGDHPSTGALLLQRSELEPANRLREFHDKARRKRVGRRVGSVWTLVVLRSCVNLHVETLHIGPLSCPSPRLAHRACPIGFSRRGGKKLQQ
jgi:hypothetical protein